MPWRTERCGTGRPLLFVHGLGGSVGSWGPILGTLAAKREVIAIDLSGFGATPPLPGEVSIRTLADALTEYLRTNGLIAIDAVGSSMGARLVLELARRGGALGVVVALDPGGFWRGWERGFFYCSIYLSIRLVRLLQPLMPFMARHAWTRALLLPQFSHHPSRLPPSLVLDEMQSYAASPSFDELLHQLAYGETQQGAAPGSIRAPLLIGWGRRDRVCLPRQARRALAAFPDAQLQWFDDSGHFPHWDMSSQTAQIILQHTARSSDEKVPSPAQSH